MTRFLDSLSDNMVCIYDSPSSPQVTFAAKTQSQLDRYFGFEIPEKKQGTPLLAYIVLALAATGALLVIAMVLKTVEAYRLLEAL